MKAMTMTYLPRARKVMYGPWKNRSTLPRPSLSVRCAKFEPPPMARLLSDGRMAGMGTLGLELSRSPSILPACLGAIISASSSNSRSLRSVMATARRSRSFSTWSRLLQHRHAGRHTQQGNHEKLRSQMTTAAGMSSTVCRNRKKMFMPAKMPKAWMLMRSLMEVMRNATIVVRLVMKMALEARSRVYSMRASRLPHTAGTASLCLKQSTKTNTSSAPMPSVTKIMSTTIMSM
mmetsp:Transcript_26537/g.68180  ORF Transcript_26537/g.68180 Transcript_26537/m.68180 type:complete len:233 (+) Transcript_26537:1403-2101(+)